MYYFNALSDLPLLGVVQGIQVDFSIAFVHVPAQIILLLKSHASVLKLERSIIVVVAEWWHS